MKTVFWWTLGIILYTYLGYPVAIWILSRVHRRTWRIASISPGLSIVLAVHNGIALLPGKLRHLLSLDYSHLREVIVVSDGSGDGTAEFLARQQHPLLRTIILEKHQGKAAALNVGMAKATADIILFVDIRPEIQPGAVQRLISNFADPKVGCVAGELLLRREGHDTASAAVGGMYWSYEQWIRTCESAFDSPVGVYGGFYAVRRELAVPQPVGIILDDMFQPLSIIRQGYRSVLDPEAVVYDTWPGQIEREFQRKVRTLAGNFQLFQLAPWTLSLRNRVLFQLVSHKLLRLIVPYLGILLLVCTVALGVRSHFYAGVAVLELLSLALALIGLFVRVSVLQRIAGPASALLLLNAAAVVGFYRFLTTRGPLWKIWTSREATSTSAPPARESMAQFEAGVVAGPGGGRNV
ncbi:MAG TPA: glycosyltransferase family 2 protein [Terracidiphilus sp.]|nr:glycosyltransferase family 2 protein [Terracidiphilus sp.]